MATTVSGLEPARPTRSTGPPRPVVEPRTRARAAARRPVDRPWSARGSRASTVQAHRRAIESVITAMHARYDEPWSLRAMADLASLSPAHFNRVFSVAVGVPPGRFLSAIRLEAAKRLLLESQLSVTDVCFEVGYSSLGTFSAQFAQLVGLPPKHLRRLAERDLATDLAWLGGAPPPADPGPRTGLAVVGAVAAPSGWTGPVCVGLFQTPMPQGRPVACALLERPGYYRIEAVPDGRHFLFAAGLAPSVAASFYLAPRPGAVLVGAGQAPLSVVAGRVHGPTSLVLRPTELTDPPIVVALPLLVGERAVAHQLAASPVAEGR